MPKRSKVLTIAKLKAKLDWVFKAYIRQRDLRDDGTFVCISCGMVKTKDQMHAGHFWAAGKFTNVRWDENNCHGQCAYCNTFLHGSLYLYSENLKDLIGTGAFERLKERAHSTIKLDREWLQEKIDYYSKLIKS